MVVGWAPGQHEMEEAWIPESPCGRLFQGYLTGLGSEQEINLFAHSMKSWRFGEQSSQLLVCPDYLKNLVKSGRLVDKKSSGEDSLGNRAASIPEASLRNCW